MLNNPRLDLNLFLVLDAVMTERSVTRAGDRLAMSQPAVSNAINRARHLLKDRLFIKGRSGVTPTPYMTTIWPELHGMIEASQRIVSREQFDPKTLRGNFCLSMSDSLARRAIPDLIKKAACLSPMTCIQAVQHSNAGSAKAVQQGELDCAVGSFPIIPGELHTQIIAEDEMVCIMREGHPLSGQLTPASFAAAGHISVTPSGRNQGFVDAPLSKYNERRKIIALVNSYLDAIEVVASTDFLACTPRHSIPRAMARRYRVRVERLPFKAELLQYKLIWHNRFDLEPSHQWFRQLIRDVVATVEGPVVAQLPPRPRTQPA